MNELLQKHGCANVFNVPEGLKELMSDITREVLRAQPGKLFDFIANYLSALIITREHGVMAVKILDDLCDCRPSVTEHLEAAGMQPVQASTVASIMQEEIEKDEPEEGSETVKETQILKKILQRYPIDEAMTATVCQIARNAYRDYWYRKQLLAQSLAQKPEEPWELAAAHTLEIYKRTKPTFNELNRATEKIQAAYKGYHVRRNLLTFKEKRGPEKELPGPPIDVAASREMNLGRVVSIKVGRDDVSQMFEVDVRNKLGLPYDTTRMLTLVTDQGKVECTCDPINFTASPARRTVSQTPYSSTMAQPAVSQGHTSPPLPSVGSLIPRISFAPAPTDPGVPSDTKVAEEHALVPAHDSDMDADEVVEEITVITEMATHTDFEESATHTDGEESAVSDLTGTIPEGSDFTDGEAEGKQEQEEGGE